MNKCEDIKTVFKSEDYGLEDHTLTIDKISELDPQGNVMLVKYIAYVIDPLNNAMVFNYSPYAKLGELLDSAKMWIQCGCLVMEMRRAFLVSGLKKRYTHG